MQLGRHHQVLGLGGLETYISVFTSFQSPSNSPYACVRVGSRRCREHGMLYDWVVQARHTLHTDSTPVP